MSVSLNASAVNSDRESMWNSTKIKAEMAGRDAIPKTEYLTPEYCMKAMDFGDLIIKAGKKPSTYTLRIVELCFLMYTNE